MVTCKEGYEAGGNILTTILLCLSSGELVSEAPTVDSSCSQMLRSDTPVQSGVGVISSREVVFIGDTCMMFCAEGYQVVSNETSLSMRACTERTSESKFGPLTPRTVKGLRCSTCERTSCPRSRRPSRIPTDGERFNEELFVDVCY